MQFHWLNKKNNENLIIFFCGWSFDYKPFERLVNSDFDVLVIYDYADIADCKCLFENLKLKSDTKNYKSKILLAWSMGVYVAYLVRDFLPDFDNKIAINGTPYPVDDEFGIPIKTFNLTLKFVDTGLQGKFQKNLFKLPEDFQKYTQYPVGRATENQKAELIALNDYVKNAKIEYTEFYNRAIISDTDKIIPTRNQLNFWKNKSSAEITLLNSGHFPFFEFDSWKDIICEQTLKQ